MRADDRDADRDADRAELAYRFAHQAETRAGAVDEVATLLDDLGGLPPDVPASWGHGIWREVCASVPGPTLAERRCTCRGPAYNNNCGCSCMGCLETSGCWADAAGGGYLCQWCG